MQLQPRFVCISLVVGFMSGVFGHGESVAASEVPTSAHPRIVLNADLRAAWKKAGRDKSSVVARMISTCEKIQRDPKEYDHDVYMGFTWAAAIQNCLVAWVATDKPAYADTAIRYFSALLDDKDQRGDGKGGDELIRRDDGYSMRSLGPFTALAYDWLYDFPTMTPALKAHARARWAAWIDWYRSKGYHSRVAASNYQAGFLSAATLIAIAQSDESGAAGTTLWRTVVDDLWTNDMTKQVAPGGMMDGGDWPEGWQYAPLSIAHYALAARALKPFATVPPLLSTYFERTFDRHVAAMSPSGKTFANGDTQAETGNIDVSMLTLAAVAVSDASLAYRQRAIEELRKLKLHFDDLILFEAMALDGGIASRPGADGDLRNTNATWYLAAGTSTLYARTTWGDDAMWLAAKCAGLSDIDHANADAGNIVLSRGLDDVLTDPSPYGSLSTFTSNAPTVRSAVLPDDYIPGQGYFSQETGWTWAQQMGNGTVVARCNYADQFRSRTTASDVPVAHRDIVVVPTHNGTDASVMILDEATSHDQQREMLLRFRLSAKPTRSNGRTSVVVGKSTLAISLVVAPAEVVSTIVPSTLKDCWGKTVTRGNCDAARYPVHDYRISIPGPTMRALHVLTATGGDQPTASALVVTGGRAGTIVADDVAVWGDGSSTTMSYRVALPKRTAIHVITDAPAHATVTASKHDATCEVTATGDAASKAAKPLVFSINGNCNVTVDSARRPVIGGAQRSAPSAAGSNAVAPPAKGARTGCCNAHSKPSVGLVAGLVLVVAIVGRRRRI
jgi:hypothetical protein